MVIWDGQVQGSFDNERALTKGRKDKPLTGQQIQSDKPVGSDCALWSLPVTCCSPWESLCTAQGTWFQMFSWALAELTFHLAEGQSIIFFALPHDLCARWSYQTPQWFASEPNLLLAPRRKKRGVDVGRWHLSYILCCGQNQNEKSISWLLINGEGKFKKSPAYH